MFHEESPKNYATLLDDRGLELFNITSTFSRYSDVPLTLNHLVGLEALTSLKYYVPTQEKDDLRKSGYGLVLYIQSDCETPLNRDTYVSELMKYVKVDSYGKCLRNSELPKELQTTDHLKNLYEPNFMKLVAKYKFTLAFENAACDDYITEKLWRPLIAGKKYPYYKALILRSKRSSSQIWNSFIHIFFLMGRDKIFNRDCAAYQPNLLVGKAKPRLQSTVKSSRNRSP